jgi:RNA polymerase sigma-70 factor (ECF subfamily)
MLATNAAWDHLRRVARHSRSAKELVYKVEMKVGTDPLVALVAKETSEAIQQTLGQLSQKDQTLVQLLYVAGLPPEEIAVTMNISIKTVYTKKHKINTRLQRAL